MFSSSGGRFEGLQHKLDGTTFLVPLLLDENRDPNHRYTVPLLRAAEIVAPTLGGEHSRDLKALSGKVAVILATGNGTGLILEGKNGFGSVIVSGSEDTAVAVYGTPRTHVPTVVFYDMLCAWDELRQGETEIGGGFQQRA